MRYTVKSFAKIEVNNISLMSGIDYVVKKDEQLLNSGSVFKESEL